MFCSFCSAEAGVHGIQKLALLIADVANHARDRRAIHVHIKDVQKDADAGAAYAVHGDGRNVGDLAVGGRNHGAGVVRDQRAPDRGKTTERTAASSSAGNAHSGPSQPAYQDGSAQPEASA